MRAGRLVGSAIVLVTLLNGAASYLRRVGWVDGARYDAAWAFCCGVAGTTDTPLGLGRRCAPSPDGSPARLRPSFERGEVLAYVWEGQGGELLLKLLKDLLVLALLVAGLAASLRSAEVLATSARSWPLVLLLGLLVVLGLRSALGGDWTGPLAGFRSFAFVPVALLAGPFAVDAGLAAVSRSLVALLGIQVALMPAELLRGLPMTRPWPFLDLPGRMAGTLVQPNTLGFVAVAAAAFVLSFSPEKRTRALAVGFAVALVALSGSGTGWVLLALLGGVAVLQNARGSLVLRSVVAGASVLLLCAAIPRLVNRPEILESLTARVAGYRQLLSAPAAPLAFGERPGAGTTSEETLVAVLRARGSAFPPYKSGLGETALISVVRQTGLAGALLCGVALVVSFLKDPSSRPFVAVVAAGGTVLNVTEMFPVNLLLGLVLARFPASGQRGSRGPAHSSILAR